MNECLSRCIISYHVISNMLTITILANDIISDNLYQINIFQNAHIATYDETCRHTPPKVFIQLWIIVTQLVKRKTWGYVN